MSESTAGATAGVIRVSHNHPRADFETLTWPYHLAVPFMYALGFYVFLKKAAFAALERKPGINSALVDGMSINSRRMKEGATRWPSLDTCYNFTTGQGPTALHRTIDVWWMKIRNAQAVRNRLKIARRELRAAIDHHASPGRPVRILSLAAGTAQGVIEVAAEYARAGQTIEILLVDQDATALRHARDLANRHNIEIATIEGNVLMFTRVIGEFQADIVEMMGFLDYLRRPLAIMLLKKIRKYLNHGGTFFCCHIHPNSESYFLKWVVEWDGGMLYRTIGEFQDVLVEAGFFTPVLITEPHGIHTVSVARKIS